jgi:UDPglucose 6-dehydrogenase
LIYFYNKPKLKEIIQKGIDNKKLKFNFSTEISVKDIEILWICFDTPVNNDDIADVDYVVSKIKKILTFLSDSTLIIISSQLPVGNVRSLEIYSNKVLKKKLHFSIIPENLRLGNAVDIFLNPDRIIVGIRDNIAKVKLEGKSVIAVLYLPTLFGKNP